MFASDASPQPSGQRPLPWLRAGAPSWPSSSQPSRPRPRSGHPETVWSPACPVLACLDLLQHKPQRHKDTAVKFSLAMYMPCGSLGPRTFFMRCFNADATRRLYASTLAGRPLAVGASCHVSCQVSCPGTALLAQHLSFCRFAAAVCCRSPGPASLLLCTAAGCWCWPRTGACRGCHMGILCSRAAGSCILFVALSCPEALKDAHQRISCNRLSASSRGSLFWQKG